MEASDYCNPVLWVGGKKLDTSIGKRWQIDMRRFLFFSLIFFCDVDALDFDKGGTQWNTMAYKYTNPPSPKNISKFHYLLLKYFFGLDG